MSSDKPIEFHIALNLTGLLPRDPDYWRGNLKRICLDLESKHGIGAGAWLGSYVGKAPFYLCAFNLDLESTEGLKRYKEIEAYVNQIVEGYVRRTSPERPGQA